jgi:hypothetical protein
MFNYSINGHATTTKIVLNFKTYFIGDNERQAPNTPELLRYGCIT